MGRLILHPVRALAGSTGWYYWLIPKYAVQPLTHCPSLCSRCSMRAPQLRRVSSFTRCLKAAKALPVQWTYLPVRVKPGKAQSLIGVALLLTWFGKNISLDNAIGMTPRNRVRVPASALGHFFELESWPVPVSAFAGACRRRDPKTRHRCSNLDPGLRLPGSIRFTAPGSTP